MIDAALFRGIVLPTHTTRITARSQPYRNSRRLINECSGINELLPGTNVERRWQWRPRTYVAPAITFSQAKRCIVQTGAALVCNTEFLAVLSWCRPGTRREIAVVFAGTRGTLIQSATAADRRNGCECRLGKSFA